MRFPGQYADKETSLTYNYFRDYDSALGRYTRSDPIGLRGGLNTYGYVYDRPLKLIDQRGLDIHDCMFGGPCDPGDIPPTWCLENPEKCREPYSDPGDPKFNCAFRCSFWSVVGAKPFEMGIEHGIEAGMEQGGASSAAKATCKKIVSRFFLVVTGIEILNCVQTCYACDECPIWNSPDNPDFPRLPSLTPPPRRTRR
jgi:RHS repeat-associated protein